MSQPPATQNTPAPPPLPVPDPARGLFETLLVLAGEPVELGAHLARLTASAEDLFGAGPPPDLAAEIRQRARPFELARLRVTVAPATGDGTGSPPRPQSDGCAGWQVEMAAEAVDPADLFPSRKRAGALKTLACSGGLGRHKWADRRPLASVPAPAVPLLVDGDEVLEAGRANVFAARDGALFTPADDGRILPGIARAGAIAAAREAGIRVHEGPLTLAELHAADEVFLTGSVRGVEPVGSVDDAPLAATTTLGERVADGLRRQWRTGRQEAARS